MGFGNPDRPVFRYSEMAFQKRKGYAFQLVWIFFQDRQGMIVSQLLDEIDRPCGQWKLF